MKIYAITYDRPLGLLRGDVAFLNVIRGLGPRSIRPMDRTWLVGTNLTVEQITEQLMPFLRAPADRLLILQVDNYFGVLPPQTWEWIDQVSREYY